MALAQPFETRVSPSLSAYAKNAARLGDDRIRIATGTRVLRNGDEPSAISAAATLLSQSAALRTSLGSGAKATSYLQVAYDGLAQVRDILEQLSALAAQANDSGRTPLSYATLDGQFQSGLTNIDAVVNATTFGGDAVLDGTAAAVVPVGDSPGTVTISIPDIRTSALFGSPPSLSDAAAAAAATSSVTTAGDAVAEAIAKVAAYQLRIDTASAGATRTLNAVGNGLAGLIGTDSDATARDAELLRLRQNTAATVLAQAFGVNSDLLGLLAG